MSKLHLPVSWMATAAVALILSSAGSRPARADFQLINNGSFEVGLAGWIRQDLPFSEGTFFQQSGSTSPVNFDPVPAPPSGLFAAMTDAEAGGSHVLYQDFVVPTNATAAILRFSLFIGNRAPDLANPGRAFFASPDTLDWNTTALNQQARVDILVAGSDPFSVAASDVLLNVFRTNPGDVFGPGYRDFSQDVGSLLAGRAGQTLRLRFAVAHNILPFQLGVDNVSLSSVPEPSSLALCGIGSMLGLACYGRRLRRTRS